MAFGRFRWAATLGLTAASWLALGCREGQKSVEPTSRAALSAFVKPPPKLAHSGVNAVPGVDPCRDTMLCDSFGRCSYQAKEQGKFTCLARTDADCAPSQQACKANGQCTARDGRCVATSDADCAASSGCSGKGMCSAIDDRCQARDAKDCAVRPDCRLEGACTLKKVRQGGIGMYSVDWFEFYSKEQLLLTPAIEAEVASGARDFWRDGDDSRSLPEHDGGTPNAPHGLDPRLLVLSYPPDYREIQLCWDVTPVGCRASSACKEEGLCHAMVDACHAGSNADCQASSACQRAGKCSLRDRTCVATPESCRKLPACAKLGQCALRDGQCSGAPPPALWP
jgi:hypothetical protein